MVCVVYFCGLREGELKTFGKGSILRSAENSYFYDSTESLAYVAAKLVILHIVNFSLNINMILTMMEYPMYSRVFLRINLLRMGCTNGKILQCKFFEIYETKCTD